MDTSEIVVSFGGALLIAAILWFFFGPRKALAARSTATGLQEIEVIVKGGYSPDRIQVRAGAPVRLNFVRQEANPCTEKVILPDFGIARDLPYGQSTPIEFTPSRPGKFVFHCGMNMVRGEVIAT